MMITNNKEVEEINNLNDVNYDVNNACSDVIFINENGIDVDGDYSVNGVKRVDDYKFVHIDPEYEAKQLNEKAIRAFRNAKHKQSLYYFYLAILLNPHENVYYINKAIVLHNLKRYADALATLDLVLISRNHDLHNQNDQKEKAVKIKATVLNSCGIRENEQKNNEMALAYFDKAIQLDPKNKLFHANRAGTLTRLGRFVEAIDSANRALQIDPAYSFARIQKALASNQHGISLMTAAAPNDQLQKENVDDALLYFSLAIQLNPDEKMYYINKSIALIRLERMSEALLNLEMALSIDSTYTNALVYKSLLLNHAAIQHAEEKMYEKSLCKLNVAIQLNPSNELFHLNKVDVLVTLERRDEAIEQLTRLLEVNPHSLKAKEKLIQLKNI